MNKNESLFIDKLASDLKPGRQWSPVQRALLFVALTLLCNVAAFLAYQGFRPGWTTQLLQYWRFLLELICAAIFTGSLVLTLFSKMVPGRKISVLLKNVLWVSGLGFALSLLLSFVGENSMASRVGARGLCVEEVVVYGFISAFVFLYFARKTPIGLPRQQFFIMGVAAGLIPGGLMQLACMYSPLHSLLLHYVPALVIGLLTFLLLPLFKRS